MKTFFVIICLLAVSLLIFGCTKGTFAGKAIGGAANLCGNDQLDEGEECDSPPDNSGYFTKNCNTLGFDGGRIACTADCKLDTSGCNLPPEKRKGVCGNDIKEGKEVCDTTDLGGQTCFDFGYDGGLIQCKPDCTSVDTRKCNKPDCVELYGPGYVCYTYVEWQAAGSPTPVSEIGCDTGEEEFGYCAPAPVPKSPAPVPKSCSEGWICQSPYAKVYQYANCVLGNQSVYCADGCSEGACVLKPVCGNGKVEEGEKCDDKNNAQDDGCFDCQLEGWEWSCSGEPSVCVVKIAPGNISAGNVSNSS